MTEYINLTVKGQGIVVFKPIVHGNAFFYLYNDDKTNGMKIIFSSGSISVIMMNNGINIALEDIYNETGLIHAHGAYYWFSIDSQNQVLYGGIGEPRIETVKYKYILPHNPDDIRKKNKAFLESLAFVEPINIHILRISKDPITDMISLFIKNTDELSMMDIAKMTYMPKANLSTVSQQMYDCIAGSKFILDSDDFPDFSKAIEYSIVTEGCWCNKTLKKKSTEFNKDKPNINETYLRITLGKNNGESPGIPYVMEIWPSKHYSPIHNHGGASAIIRVLHGQIHVKLFPFLCAEKDGIPIFGSADFTKDDITWISPTLNQTHQLCNNCIDTCITIQCYMYDETNKRHYDYFDYIDSYGHKQQYEPDSDMDFILFKEIIKNEWETKENKKQYKYKNV
jgi:hypothetical protein